MENEEQIKIDLSSPEWKEIHEFETKQALIEPTPNNPPWNSWVAVGVWIFSVLMISILPLIFFFPFAVSQNINVTEPQAVNDFLMNNPTAILINLVAIIPAHLLTLLLAWFVVTGFKRYPFWKTLGWKHNNFRWYSYILIIGGFFGCAYLVSLILPEQENEMMRILKSSRNATLIVAFLATFTAPLVEEVVYRGILYSAFQRSIGVWNAVALVTALFASVHFLQYWGSPGTILLICLLSLILTLVRVKTESLLPCFILHTIFNAMQSLYLVLEPYLPEAQDAASLIHLLKN